MADVIDFGSASSALEAKRRNKWQVAYGPDIARARPTIAYVCRDLAIAPGCTVFGGAGFSGKTTALQSLLLSVLSGKDAWGKFPVSSGPVMHLDYEQGEDLTYLKYVRMGRDMKIDIEGAGDAIACASIAESCEASNLAKEELRWLLRGRKAAIIDAFRGAFPNANENESGVRQYLDMVNRVGREVGCACIVICHSKKPSEGSSARTDLRGSGALFDAANTVWMLSGAKGKPTQCENTKERYRGKLRDTFGLQIDDVLGPGVRENEIDDEWGLRVSYVSPTDLQEAYAPNPMADNSIQESAERIETMARRMVDIIAKGPRDVDVMKSMIGKGPFAAALSFAISEGFLLKDGRGGSAMLSVNMAKAREPGEEG